MLYAILYAICDAICDAIYGRHSCKNINIDII